MELALSLGENHTSKSSFSVLVEKDKSISRNNSLDVGCGGGKSSSSYGGMDLGLVLSKNNNNNISRSSSSFSSSSQDQENGYHIDEDQEKKRGASSSSPSDPPPRPLAMEAAQTLQQLDLLPFSPVPRPRSQLAFPWLSQNLTCSTDQPANGSSEPRSAVNMNRFPALTATEEPEEESSPNSALSSFMEFSLYRNRTARSYGGNNNELVVFEESSPNSALSSFMEFSLYRNRTARSYGGNNNELVVFEEGGGGGGGERGTSSRAGSDDDEMNGLMMIEGGGHGSTRKKLRLSKQQSAFLEDSFKEHHTLNPKQKLALAKQLNLRPRQVEVWFQNRRARTKLKQTEVDCEYLKRCCETLTEENRRLQKELHELRALKSSQPFFMHHPATTLTMCPSCERVASTPSSSTAAHNNTTQPAATNTVTATATSTGNKVTTTGVASW